MFGGKWKRFCDSTGQLAAMVGLIGGCFLVSWEAWPIVGRWHRQRIAEQFAEQIAQTPDPGVKLPVRQLASLGTAALPSLVEAAASERAAVSRIAQQELDLALAGYLVRIRKAVDEETGEALVALATAMAANVERFGPDGKRWSERIALQIIDQADRFPVSTAASLLSQCSLVLDSVPPGGPRLQTLHTVVGMPQQETLLPTPPSIDLQTLSAPPREAQAALDRDPPIALESDGRLGETQPMEVSKPSDPLPAGDYSPSWNDLRGNPLRPGLSGEDSLSVEVQPGNRPPLQSVIVEVPTPLDMRRSLTEFRGMSTEGLLKSLPGADKFATGAIRTVLAERGMQQAELEMAVRSTSPNTVERMRLIDEVSALPASSARRLLRLLLDDQSAEIRLRALTVLATTNDPGLTELARTIAVKDEDPRVAEFASRLSRQ